MIFRVEDDSRWREVIGGCNSLSEAGWKVAGKYHNRGWGSASHGVERRRREEERESVLNNCLVQNELKQKYLAEN